MSKIKHTTEATADADAEADAILRLHGFIILEIIGLACYSCIGRIRTSFIWSRAISFINIFTKSLLHFTHPYSLPCLQVFSLYL